MFKTFRYAVYEITRRIPRGKVATYGQVAKLAGNPGAARAVGYFMKNNPDIPSTPCHRVVASNGGLTGYAAGGVSKKRKILEEEGVVFAGKKVNMELFLWKMQEE